MSLTTIFLDITRISQALDAADVPTPEAAPESYCLACQAPVAAFTSWGGDLVHYVGDPMSDSIEPYVDDHAPILA